MNHLLLVRHAETDLAGTFCGHSDPPINAPGHLQIETLLRTLSGQSFDAVYTSDLRRAHTTAAALARLFAIPWVTRPALREIHFGAWEGLTWSQIESRDPSHAQRWIDQYPNVPAPGGESFASFESRVSTEFDHILSQAIHPRVIVVSHAGVMRSFLRRRFMLDENEARARTKSYCCTFDCADAMPQMASNSSRAS